MIVFLKFGFLSFKTQKKYYFFFNISERARMEDKADYSFCLLITNFQNFQNRTKIELRNANK